MEQPPVRIPPLSTNLSWGCYHCFKGKNGGSLQRCSGCFRVCYCGPECQKANWSSHKQTCKAFKALQSKYGEDVLKLYSELTEPLDEVKVNRTINAIARIEMAGLIDELQRDPTMAERNMIGWQPRCLACGRSDSVARAEAQRKQAPMQLPSSHPCPDCLFSFCCSEEHWSIARSAHRDTPCRDGWGALSQCAMNQVFLADVTLAEQMPETEGAFRWAPERTLAEFASLRGTDWHAAYLPELKAALHGYNASDAVYDPMLRGATDALSMPLTILLALEVLNQNTDWTKKDTLVIHVLGAADIETTNSNKFEEILHRLPSVKKLELIMCGPELERISGNEPQVHDLDTCPECTQKGRKRVQILQPRAYHEYIVSSGDKFVKPDLAVAFNSGCSQEDTESWKETMTLLVKNKIPTVFTAYNYEEAADEAKLLEQAGAVLHPELGPSKNPWGSLMPKMEPNKITGFYAVNGWLAGGFK